MDGQQLDLMASGRQMDQSTCRGDDGGWLVPALDLPVDVST